MRNEEYDPLMIVVRPFLKSDIGFKPGRQVDVPLASMNKRQCSPRLDAPLPWVYFAMLSAAEGVRVASFGAKE